MKREPWRDIYDALTVGPSGITGLGLFAGTRIPARAKIGEFEGEVIGLREARRRARGKRIVAIVELEKHALDATDTGRGFRFINHSCAPNTYIRCTKERAEFYAIAGRLRRGRSSPRLRGNQHNGKLRCLCGAKGCRGAI
jgi:hypothetical protein